MKMRSRHPAEVTADRLEDHFRRYRESLSYEDIDTLARAALLLRRLADSDSTPKG